MSKRALIIGVSGQDGAYLARHLLEKGYEVIGTSRDAENNSFTGLTSLGIRNKVTTDSLSTSDFRSVAQAFQKYQPKEVYNLSGQSSVGLSFNQPGETIESHLQATITILEVMKFLEQPIRFYNACSSECFGDVSSDKPATEETPFQPRSPYAVGKAAAFWAVANYRDAYGLYACSGILGNHESPLRPARFVTQKIIRTVSAIANGEASTLTLGDTSVIRDWGLSQEYVEAMVLMLQRDMAEDYVIATGQSYSLWEFVEKVFTYYGLQVQNHVLSDNSFMRPSDIRQSYLNPTKAMQQLNWKAEAHIDRVIACLAEHQ
ncbi:MAG: GDP-mannose 4,6-dehydratase [Arenicella sp.]